MNTFIIAEVGQAHEGSLGILHSYIDAISKTGVNAIKFQTHIAEAESSVYEPFRVKFSYEDETRFDYWKRMEFTEEQWIGIRDHCDSVGMEFISSPFSNAAVDLLEKLGVKRYKIGSGEVSNFLMLTKIAKTGKDIILSSGMSNYDELKKTIDFLEGFNNKVSILQCTTEYPTKPTSYGLNVISELKEKFGLDVGFSDHSGSIYPGIAAASMGAKIIEVHTIFDKMLFGPDSTSSLTIKQLKKLVKGIRLINEALVNPIDKSDNSKFKDVKSIFEKSLSINRDMKKGEVIHFEDLEAKKPAKLGISANQFDNVIGKRLSHDLPKWSFINESDML